MNENIKLAAERAVDFVEFGGVASNPLTAEAHIKGLAKLIKTLVAESDKEAVRNAALDSVLEIVQHARDHICAGGLPENRQHEESVVHPYLDRVCDEIDSLKSQPVQPGANPIAWVNPEKGLEWLADRMTVATGTKLYGAPVKPAQPSDTEIMRIITDYMNELEYGEHRFSIHKFGQDQSRELARRIKAAMRAEREDK